MPAARSSSRLLPVLALLVLLSLGSVQAFQPAAPITTISGRSQSRYARQQSSPSPTTTSSISTSRARGARPPLSPWALAAQPSSSSGGGGLDGLFRLIRNDALSLTVGSICLIALVANRLATPDLYDSQSRTDIIGVISAGGLLLNGLTLQVGSSRFLVHCGD